MCGTGFCWPWATMPCSQQAVAGAGTAALLSKGSLSSPRATADTGAGTPHCHACRGGLTRIPTPSPSGRCPCRCSRPVASRGLSMRAAAGPAALPSSTAGPPPAAPASAVVTLCFAPSQHPSLSSPICLMLLGPPPPPFIKWVEKQFPLACALSSYRILPHSCLGPEV